MSRCSPPLDFIPQDDFRALDRTKIEEEFEKSTEKKLSHKFLRQNTSH